MANHLKLPGLSSTKENLISSQSDVDIAAALPLYDVAVAKTIEFLADTRYIMSPSLRLLTYPHCLSADGAPVNGQGNALVDFYMISITTR